MRGGSSPSSSSSYGGSYDDRYGYGDGDGDGDGDDSRGYNKDAYDYGREKGYRSSESRGEYYDDERLRGDRYNGDDGGGYYDDDGRYCDDGGRRGSGSSSSSSPPPRRSSTKIMNNMPSVLQTGNRKIGTMLLGAGAAFTMLGISLFFNKALMRLGNLLFVAGVPMMIGPGRTMGYFLQPKKARATGCLFAGIILVFIGHPVIGIVLEIFGLLNLFGNMFPFVMVMLKQLPVIGPILSGNGGGGSGSGRDSRRRNESYDDRYDDGYYGDNNNNDRY